MKTLLILAAAASLASAQPKTPDMAVFVFTDVIPSMTADYQAASVAIRDTYKKNGVPFYLSYDRLFAGTRTLSVTPLSDLSSRDNGTPIRKMMGEEAYQKWVPQFRRTHSGNEFVVVRTVPNTSIQDAPIGSLPVVVVTRTRVAPDRRAEYEARIRDVTIPALKKAGAKRYVLTRVMFGGGSNEYITVRSHNGLVEADKANQVIASAPPAAGLVLSSERMVYRINPQLSYAQGVEIR